MIFFWTIIFCFTLIFSTKLLIDFISYHGVFYNDKKKKHTMFVPLWNNVIFVNIPVSHPGPSKEASEHTYKGSFVSVWSYKSVQYIIIITDIFSFVVLAIVFLKRIFRWIYVGKNYSNRNTAGTFNVRQRGKYYSGFIFYKSEENFPARLGSGRITLTKLI